MNSKIQVVRSNAGRRRNDRRRALLHLHLNNTDHIEEQLQREIENLNSKLEGLKSSNTSVDFALVQTYEEMLHSRKKFFREINRTPVRLW